MDIQACPAHRNYLSLACLGLCARLMDRQEMTGQPGPRSCLSISMTNTQLKIFCDGCAAIWWRFTFEVLSIVCGSGLSLVNHDLPGNRKQQNTAAQQGLFPDRLVKEYPDPKRSKKHLRK